MKRNYLGNIKPRKSHSATNMMCVCVCVCIFVHVCIHGYVWVCWCVCVGLGGGGGGGYEEYNIMFKLFLRFCVYILLIL